MTTDYDQISEQYRQAKKQPWRAAVEEYSFLQLIGDLSDKRVVDIACGEGFFTRKLRERGAAQVVGIDISHEMIALANAQEAAAPLGIQYKVEDARAAGADEGFDVAVAAWLLVYAHDRCELDVMSRGLARRVRPGGRMVTLTTNPELCFFNAPDYRKYGFDVRVESRAYEGAPIVWTIHLDDSSFDIENYYLPLEAYAESLERAGFRDVAFHALSLDPDYAARDGADHWAVMLNNPPAVMIDAMRA